MPSQVMWTIRKVLGTVGGRTLAILLVLVVLYQVWLGVTAAGKVADGVGSDLDPRGHFAVEVVLGFQPERFHVLALQDYGRVRGTDGNTVQLRSVTQEGVDAMARKYWIRQILPAKD